jgi:hypothetical protein
VYSLHGARCPHGHKNGGLYGAVIRYYRTRTGRSARIALFKFKPHDYAYKNRRETSNPNILGLNEKHA